MSRAQRLGHRSPGHGERHLPRPTPGPLSSQPCETCFSLLIPGLGWVLFQQFLVLPLRVVKFYPLFRAGRSMLPGPALSLMGQQGKGWGALSLTLAETLLGGLWLCHPSVKLGVSSERLKGIPDYHGLGHWREQGELSAGSGPVTGFGENPDPQVFSQETAGPMETGTDLVRNPLSTLRKSLGGKPPSSGTVGDGEEGGWSQPRHQVRAVTYLCRDTT